MEDEVREGRTGRQGDQLADSCDRSLKRDKENLRERWDGESKIGKLFRSQKTEFGG